MLPASPPIKGTLPLILTLNSKELGRLKTQGSRPTVTPSAEVVGSSQTQDAEPKTLLLMFQGKQYSEVTPEPARRSWASHAGRVKAGEGRIPDK